MQATSQGSLALLQPQIRLVLAARSQQYCCSKQRDLSSAAGNMHRGSSIYVMTVMQSCTAEMTYITKIDSGGTGLTCSAPGSMGRASDHAEELVLKGCIVWCVAHCHKCRCSQVQGITWLQRDSAASNKERVPGSAALPQSPALSDWDMLKLRMLPQASLVLAARSQQRRCSQQNHSGSVASNMHRGSGSGMMPMIQSCTAQRVAESNQSWQQVRLITSAKLQEA